MPTENQDSPAGVINAMAQQQQQQQQPQAQQQHQQSQQPQQVHHQQVAPSQQQAQQPTTSVTSPTVAAAQAAQAAQAAATAAAAVGVQPIQNTNAIGPTGSDENLACQWQGCVEICPSPEALYEHVCERHVGRKSTNNLNLTCHWGGCRTTVVKRDHITSHIRVHVPLKPHKCDFCGKSFKRPQDLKKHVKTHADDSVLVKSPDPPGAPRQPNVMYSVPGAKGHYFESSMNQVPGQPYGHGGPQYYQHPHPQPQPNQSYGNVYYTTTYGDGNQHAASMEAKRRRDIIQDFVGLMKREEFDPTSYSAVSNRLVNLHGIQLPLASSDPIPEYQHAPAMVGVGGPGGYQAASMPPQMYQLPPMNLRTKADLMNIDRFLEQMQSTVYEGNEAAAAGVGQPGAHFVHGGVTYSSNNSPPTTATQPPSSHATATSSAPIAAATPSAHSPHSSTPALTPPSSAQSYTSARSPTSISSTNQRSPLLNQQQNALTSAGMYPTLPAPNAQDNFPAGYPTSSSSAAPASTLGTAFDNDDRRRYTGGTLQRSRPAEINTNTRNMETSKSGNGDHSRTTPTKENPHGCSPGSVAFSANLVDPALRSHTSPHPSAESPREKRDSPSGNKSATPSPGSTSQDDSLWVENIRIIECLRQYVSERLERGLYEDEDNGGETHGKGEERRAGSADVHMGGTESNGGHSEGHETSREADAGENLYPILKALESDDGDVKMGSSGDGGS